MGNISDFVVAAPEEADAILDSGFPYDNRPALEVKGLDHTEIASLFAKITNEPCTDELMDEFSCLAEVEEQWIYLIPDRVTQAIAQVADHQIAEIGKAWQEDEDRPPMCTIAEWSEQRAALPGTFRELVKLARTALDKGTGLLMYISM